MTSQTLSTFTLPCFIFLLTLAFGLWLGLSGKPYHGLLFNVHKLVALGAVILMAIQLNKVFRGVEIQAIPVALIVTIGICFVALFATGALLSLGKLSYLLLRAIHSLASVLVAIALVMIISLLTT